MTDFKYLRGYPEHLLVRIGQMRDSGELGPYLERKYPGRHDIQTDKALYHYVDTLRQEFLRNAPRIDKVLYDSKLDVIRNALGLHTAMSRPHGGKLKASKEIRIAGVFRDAPPEFLRMIAVHELAHLREKDHNKAFYQLCEHMQPGYGQLEFDLRVWLTWREDSPV